LKIKYGAKVYIKRSKILKKYLTNPEIYPICSAVTDDDNSVVGRTVALADTCRAKGIRSKDSRPIIHNIDELNGKYYLHSIAYYIYWYAWKLEVT